MNTHTKSIFTAYIPSEKSYTQSLNKVREFVPPTILQTNWIAVSVIGVIRNQIAQVAVKPYAGKPYRYIICVKLHELASNDTINYLHKRSKFIRFSREEDYDGFYVEIK